RRADHRQQARHGRLARRGVFEEVAVHPDLPGPLGHSPQTVTKPTDPFVGSPIPMIYDITPPITARLAVWPGDTPSSREVLLARRRGDNTPLPTRRATVHRGAHADAPSHYGAEAPTIDQRSLDYYLGECQVMRVNVARKTRVIRAMLTGPVTAPRLLL